MAPFTTRGSGFHLSSKRAFVSKSRSRLQAQLVCVGQLLQLLVTEEDTDETRVETIYQFFLSCVTYENSLFTFLHKQPSQKGPSAMGHAPYYSVIRRGTVQDNSPSLQLHFGPDLH